MARTFLPPPSPTSKGYAVDPSPGGFHRADAGLLSEVGANMAVSEAQTEGRVPTPFSRAYMFYMALAGRALATAGNVPDDADASAGAGREALRLKARATFRGVCAVFALREALGLEIDVRRVTLLPEDDRLARLLLPTLHGAPGGEGAWRPMRLFTVRRKGDTARPEVLGAFSPLTGVFPAANAPHRALTGVFWYEAPAEQGADDVWRDASGTERPPAAIWHDPTGPTPTGPDAPLDAATRAAVRGAMARWLAAVRAQSDRTTLEAAGLDRTSADLLTGEFEAWARELERDTALPTVGVDTAEAPPSAFGERPLPPFLTLVCSGVDASVLSDFPVRRGRLLVSRSALLDPRRRLWGRTYGHRDLTTAAGALPFDGDNLGRALGLGDRAVPVPFLNADQLFTPVFTRVASSGVALSPEWRALPVQNGEATEHALYPFRKEILHVLSADDLAAATTARFSNTEVCYLVQLRLGDQTITQRYTTQGEDGYAIDGEVPADLLDVRLFPDFDLDAPGVQALLPPPDADGRQPEKTYYARVRRAPSWAFEIRPFEARPANAGGDGAASGEVDVVVAPAGAIDARRRSGAEPAGPGEAFAPGPVEVFTLGRKPDGFWFGDRGLCFVRLAPPPNVGGIPVTWNVAVDFGTSNTCVAYTVAGKSDAAAALPLPVLTTTLLRQPVYGVLGGANEGASAALDFFYKYAESDEWLLGRGAKEVQPAYFPTQVVTTQNALRDGIAAPFDLADGLILFRNLSLSNVEVLKLVEGFETEALDRGEAVRPLEKRFRLEQDIKWTRQEWLRAFMAHLRRQVVLTAVHGNARIASAAFSYPKAFNGSQRKRFRVAIKSVWGDLFDGQLVSESEAVRSFFDTDTLSQRVVVDIGGGTTDVIGFVGGRPTFQTSFKLAAGAVSEYVLASKTVRELLLNAAQTVGAVQRGAEKGTTEDLFTSGPDQQVLNAWTGLLQAVEEAAPNGGAFDDLLGYLVPDGASAKDLKAIQGLLLTVALLFGGTAFLAGRLLRAATDGAFGTPSTLDSAVVTLTGNGSKLYRLLTPEPGAFDGVVEALVRAGAGRDALAVEMEGIHKTNGREAPKTTVALGMLQGSGTAAAEIPVANLVGEALDGAVPRDDLAVFYRQVLQHAENFRMPDEAPPELAAFLGALGAAMPRGLVGDVEVLPGMQTGWTDALAGPLYRASREAAKSRLWTTARETVGADDGADAGVTALEPAFVAELAALVAQIRREYA